MAPFLARDWGVQRAESDWQPPARRRPSDDVRQVTVLRRVRLLLTSLVVR